MCVSNITHLYVSTIILFFMFKIMDHIFKLLQPMDLDKFNKFLRSNSYLILVLAAYMVLGMILLPHYQYIVNADGFSYITIAQKYAHGDFSNAINGLWSPLISWLLSVLLWFNTSPEYAVFAFKFLSLVIGLFALIGIHLLSLRFDIKEKIRISILIASIPMILSLSLTRTTPDLLLLSFLLFYLYIIFDYRYTDNLLRIMLCGVLGALAYFTKSYIFVFFPIHFIIMNLLNYFKIRKNKIKLFKTLFIGLATFFIISSMWVGIISDKYGYLTFGTASEYNHDLVGPNIKGHHPLICDGLLFKPPNKTALSAWEDPSYYKLESWNPLSSWKLFKYQLNFIFDNSLIFLLMITLFSALSIPILLISLVYLIRSPNNLKYSLIIIYSMITISIYSMGFFPINFERRYILIDFVLLFLLGGHLCTISSVKKAFAIILIISFIIMPFAGLYSGFNANKDLYDLSQTLKNDYHVHGNIASTGGYVGWEDSHFISFYLNCQYYSGTSDNNVEKLKKELKNNDINYYLAWDKKGTDSINLPFKEITTGSKRVENGTEYLKVYYVN